MTFVVDTSSAICAVGLLDGAGAVRAEVRLPARSPDLRDAMRELAKAERLDRVAVATGPGSFTGLRAGVSFGLGLAVGFGLPIVPLPTLAIQAARSDEAVLAVAEAGRGRVYYQAPGHAVAHGEPADLPKAYRAAGWLQPATARSLVAAGVRLVADAELRPWGEAVARVLETAREVPYRNLRIDYMNSLARKG